MSSVRLTCVNCLNISGGNLVIWSFFTPIKPEIQQCCCPVCLVCLQDYAKTTQTILTELGEGLYSGPRKNRLYSGADPLNIAKKMLFFTLALVEICEVRVPICRQGGDIPWPHMTGPCCVEYLGAAFTRSVDGGTSAVVLDSIPDDFHWLQSQQDFQETFQRFLNVSALWKFVYPFPFFLMQQLVLSNSERDSRAFIIISRQPGFGKGSGSTFYLMPDSPSGFSNDPWKETFCRSSGFFLHAVPLVLKGRKALLFLLSYLLKHRQWF